MKNRLKKFFQNVYNNIGIYSISIICSVTLSLTLVYYKTKTQEKEKFSIFFTTDTLNRDVISSSIDSLMQEYGILEQYYYSYSIEELSEDDYNSSLMNKGISLSDFMIVPSSVMTDNFLGFYCKQYKSYFPGHYDFGGQITWALKVYDHSTQTSNISNIASFELDEDYYLCISKYSYHYNNYIKNDNSLLGSFIDWIINYEEN